MRLLSTILRRVITQGHLAVIDASGSTHHFGEQNKPPVTIKFHDRRIAAEIALHPQLKFGEAYMDGRLTVENGATIADVMDLLQSNLGLGVGGGHMAWIAKASNIASRLFSRNSRRRAKSNVAHHYDLSGKLYDLFLDSDKQYSCAFFETPNDTLEVAQTNKKKRIAAKLALTPGMRVLDIGSGWGGMAVHLAQTADVDVTGITLSEEQLKIANERVRGSRLKDHVRFRLEDYRNTNEKFERIVSVGMFEHVGLAHYQTYFDKIASLMTAEGVALVHTIGRADGPGGTNPWIEKYIFPGGYVPALSEVLPAIERSGLIVTDVEVLRLHYAYTLAEWRRRFVANWDRAARVYDERFCRMWEFFLAGSEMAFRHQGQVVFQLQLSKRIDTLPLTRNYMAPTLENTSRFVPVDDARGSVARDVAKRS
ncbi:MAG: methyltransferase domain-containing protein [Alphaproteobacteria bacterium]|nr:methyltransferase domain-containing protein [Alphaproteobacteria bacterium]